MLDIGAEALAMAKAYLPFPELDRFACCEKYSASFVDTLTSLVELYAKQVSSLESDILSSNEALEVDRSL